MLEREEGLKEEMRKHKRRCRTINIATLNKIIEDFSHLPLDDKEYAIEVIRKQLIEALVIITEWNQFRRLDFKRIKKIMKDTYIFDLRNIYSKEIIEKENAFKYFSVGR